MSVMPIVCETVAAGLACGRRTFGGCCATTTSAAQVTIRTEMSETETRLIEIMVESPYCKVCGALCVAVEASRNKVRGEFTTFYKNGPAHSAEKRTGNSHCSGVANTENPAAK